MGRVDGSCHAAMFCRIEAMGYLISFVFGIFVATIGLGGRAPVLDAHWSPAHQTAPGPR